MIKLKGFEMRHQINPYANETKQQHASDDFQRETKTINLNNLQVRFQSNM